MLNSELFIKLRANFVLGFMVVIFPITITLAVLYRIIEFISTYSNFKNIAGEIAVVTGSGHGLGRCIALRLAKKGAHIAVVDINIDGAKETVQLIKDKYKVECKAYEVDVTDYSQVENLNNEIKKDLGVATILVNNAGLVAVSNFARPSCEEIERMINVNVKAHFWTNRVFLENMKEQKKGHIVAICSIAGCFPLVYNSLYCATKFAVRGMMRSLRLDLIALKLNYIKTTTVCPTFLTTNDTVRDLSNKIQIGNYYPLVKGEDATRAIVDAMLRNEVEITIPRGFAILTRIFDFFPSAYQDKLWFVTTTSFVKKFRTIYKAHEQQLSKVE